MLNDRDMATEMVTKEIGNDHHAYWIVHRMSLWDDHQHLIATDTTAEGLHMEVERITGRPTVPSHWPRRLPNGVPKNQKTIAAQHTELNAKPRYQRTTKWLRRSKRMCCRICLPRRQNLHIHYTKRLSTSRSSLLSRWVWPHTVKLTSLIWINDYTAHADSIDAFYHP